MTLFKTRNNTFTLKNQTFFNLKRNVNIALFVKFTLNIYEHKT